MATTCKLIAKNVLGSDTATVTLGSIPAIYDDLLLVMSCRGSNSSLSRAMNIGFNGSTSNFSARVLEGDGASATSAAITRSVGNIASATATASTFNNTEVYIPNYAGSTNKSFSATDCHETNGATAYIAATALLWSDTSAITSIELALTAGNLVSGSSFFLYGITKA